MKPQRYEKRDIDGWLALDKPSQMSSASAVAKIRRLYRARKIGHGGTLDPLAYGVLPLALGNATKTMQFMVDATKEYRFTIEWGQQTSTDDNEGAIIARSAVRPNRADIIAALSHFIGHIMQTPPAFSALKQNGVRAYKIARSGDMPIMTPRRVHVHNLELIDMPDAHHSVFYLTCGKGVYVRALARDLGLYLNTCGHVSDLCRTRVGKFSKKNTITLDKLIDLGHSRPDLPSETFSLARQAMQNLDSVLLPITTVLDDILALAVTDTQADMLRCGRALTLARQIDDSPDAYVHVQNIPIALGQIKNGVFIPRRVFHAHVSTTQTKAER